MKFVVKDHLCDVFSKLGGDLPCKRAGTAAPLFLNGWDVMC